MVSYPDTVVIVYLVSDVNHVNQIQLNLRVPSLALWSLSLHNPWLLPNAGHIQYSTVHVVGYCTTLTAVDIYRYSNCKTQEPQEGTINLIMSIPIVYGHNFL